jgi:type IV secretory pathway component VirB8
MSWWKKPREPGLLSDGEPMGASWPRGHDTGDEARRSRFVGRWFATVSGISMAMNLVFVGAMLSQRNTCNVREPFFLQTSPQVDAVVEVKPFKEPGDPVKISTRIWAKQFVERRHTIYTDVPAQTRNLVYLKARTADTVWRSIEEERTEIVKLIQAGISRRVYVNSAVEQSPRFYLVDFTVVDSRDGKEVSRSMWRAGLRVDFLARSVPRKDLLDDDATNPFGFVVTSYVPEPLGKVEPGKSDR